MTTFFFFFQAEDGIRDVAVTGVQTCALPICMKKIHKPEELWPWLDKLGDQQSFYLLEQFVPGSVYHVDSVTSERKVVFAEAHAYGAPPLETSHQGGVFTTRTLPRDGEEARALHQ